MPRYDCNDECKEDPLKRSPQMCGCGQVDDVDNRYEQVRLGPTENLKSGAPYPLGAPGDVTCGGNANKARCEFPFEYAGKTYHTCTTAGHSQQWCVAGTGAATGLRFGNCDCPGMRGHSSLYLGVYIGGGGRGFGSFPGALL